MKLVNPGVYLTETDLSEVKGVWFCECCDRAFKYRSGYLSHIRNKKINKILKKD